MEDGQSFAAPAAPPQQLQVDGVRLDPATLAAVDAAGTALAVSRMGVRELRAELAARRAAVGGNKKDLAKRLQKLRQLDARLAAAPRAGAGERKSDTGRKVRARGVAVVGSGARA